MQSLNLPYAIYELYLYLTGLSSGAPTTSQLVHALNVLAWIGISVSVFLFGLWVYLYFRAERYTHGGWGGREEQEIMLMNVKETEQSNERWEQAVTLANSLNVGDWRRAVLEADILLHEMLIEKGFAGNDVGEQLRGASHAHFQTLDMAWEAHRIRNLIAHEGETFPLDQRTTLTTMDKYRNVFEEFGYI